MLDKTILREDEITKFIPQRSPFVLVHSMYNFGKDDIESGFVVPENHVLVNKEGQLTETGLIENIAQTIALHNGYYLDINNLEIVVGYIASIRNMKILSLPRVGQEIRTKIWRLQKVMGVTIVKGEIYLQDQLIASGEMRTVEAATGN